LVGLTCTRTINAHLEGDAFGAILIRTEAGGTAYVPAGAARQHNLLTIPLYTTS